MIDQILIQFYRDITAMPILMHGLQAALLISLVCSTLSVFVVLKRLAFIGEGIAHSALGGIALGVVLFVSGPMIEQTFSDRIKMDLTTAVFCVVVAWLIGWTSRRKIISEDTSIGIFFVASMAFGVILISLRRAYTADLFSFLFGSVLAVGAYDVYVTAVLAVFVIAVAILFYRQMFLYCLDEELANVSGTPVGLIHYGLLTVLALTIVISVKILGVLLVAAFLVIPGATARMLTLRYRNMFLIANVMGFFAVTGGLLLSNVIADLPSGPMIVMGLFLMFLLAVLWSSVRDRHLRGRQLPVVGTSLVIVGYLAIVWSLSVVSLANSSGSSGVIDFKKTTLLDRSDWDFFVTSLENRQYRELNARIDGDPVFVEQLIRSFDQLPLAPEDRRRLIYAIDTAAWDEVPRTVIEDLEKRD